MALTRLEDLLIITASRLSPFVQRIEASSKAELRSPESILAMPSSDD